MLVLGRLPSFRFLSFPLACPHFGRVSFRMLRRFWLGYWRIKVWRKGLAKVTDFYLNELGFRSFSPCFFFSLLGFFSLTLASIFFSLLSLSLKAFSFLFSLTLPRIFSQTFAKEKQKWEFKSLKPFYT